MEPEKVAEWLTILGLLAGWVIGVSKWIERQNRLKAKVAHDRLENQINGLGERVNSLVVTVGQHETALDNVNSEQAEARRDRKEFARDIARIGESLDKLAQLQARHHGELMLKVGDITVNQARLEERLPKRGD